MFSFILDLQMYMLMSFENKSMTLTSLSPLQVNGKSLSLKQFMEEPTLSLVSGGQ